MVGECDGIGAGGEVERSRGEKYGDAGERAAAHEQQL